MIRRLAEPDIPEARRILQLAFGAFVGAPDPERFFSDIDYVTTRWRADERAAFVAEIDGKIVGSNFATCWGSVGFFGPLTVHPDLWNHGIAQQLMQPVMECFDRWKVTHAGLYTFAESPKHIALYQRYGFYPRFLTAILSKKVEPGRTDDSHHAKCSELSASDLGRVIESCYRLTDSIYPGLNVEREIRAVHAQRLGDTVMIWNDRELLAFAVCHCGPGTEAGNNNCYIKFGAASPGPDVELHFEMLIRACESLAASRGLTQLVAGVNLSRHEAYSRILAQGFCIDRTGATMHRPSEPGYSRADVFVIDDWR